VVCLPAGQMPQEIPVSNAFDDDKERIRESVNIAELVGSYINLRRQGSALVGICPWHNDSNVNRGGVGFATSVATSSAS